MKIKSHIVWPDTKEFMKSVGLNDGGKVQKYIDNFVIEESVPYLPGKTHLYQSSRISTKLGSGLVIWNTPDANYLYEGKLMVDPITLKGAFYSPDYGFWSRPGTQKILDPQGRDLNYNHGGSKWFDKMIDDKMSNLLKGVENIINGGKE